MTTPSPPRIPHSRRTAATLACAFAIVFLAACGSAPKAPQVQAPAAKTGPSPTQGNYFVLEEDAHAREMVLFALGLLDTGYRFGGRNPEAGLDCSGMVAWIVENISGKRLPHNAAQIADRTRPIDTAQLQPGDLVFFNTLKRRHSHMGIYIGDGRFVHAPSSRGAVRIESLSNRYFAQRIDGARTLVASN